MLGGRVERESQHVSVLEPSGFIIEWLCVVTQQKLTGGLSRFFALISCFARLYSECEITSPATVFLWTGDVSSGGRSVYETR